VIAATSPAGGQTPDLLGALHLSADDLLLARRQKVCPITRLALGSMGPPVRVEVEGETVFLCCQACKDSVKSRSRLPDGTSPPEPTAESGPARQAGPTAEPRQP
jgi:membrane fusion protein, copper/silver efflux system